MRTWTYSCASRLARLFVAFMAAGGIGCGGETLPVRHVAIYRNGVAYLERSGHVIGSDVRFRMKDSEIGDFLATVAVTERGGGSVRSTALPIDAAGKDQVHTVVLTLDGGVHDLRVGYIAQAPVWKPSYRLVMGDDGTSDFQVWGLVQNVSGEDWRDVRLSLVAGAPIAFSSDMQTPVIPDRPTVVDRGESIGAVPQSEGNYAPARAAARQALVGHPDVSALAGMRDGSARMHGYKFQDDPRAAESSSAGSGAETVTPELIGGSTRYELPLPVNIPNDSTSMMMVLSRRVKGEEVFLFAPNAGIPASAAHPFRAIRFTNDTGGELERGPIALFQRGLFLGQALLEAVPLGTSATLPFALDRGISVDVETKAGGSAAMAARVAKIADGKLTVAVAHGVRTAYRLRNEGEQSARVLVKHRMAPHSKLLSPPAGTEERIGANTALVPATAPSHDTAELIVDEQSEEFVTADWFEDVAGYAVRAYLADSKSDRDVVSKLSAAWPPREDIVAKTRERDHLRQQRYDLQQETEEIRKNLKAAGGGTGDALRAQLGSRLTQAQGRMADDDKKILALDADIGRLSDQFKKVAQELRLVP
jgi:hypothetical protein